MFEGNIYISEVTAAKMAFNRSYIKDIAGTAKLYIYIPYISYTAATLREVEKLFENGQIPLSAYDQALINAPLGSSGEFETTEAVALPLAADVYNAILDTQDATLIGLVSPTDTLAQLATNILVEGYLITFDNIDMFINNSAAAGTVTVRTITADDTLTAADDIIEIDASSNPVELTLTATSTKVIGVKRIDKTNNKASIIVTASGTIDGQDCLVIEPITNNEPDLYIQLYYSTTDSEYKIIA